MADPGFFHLAAAQLAVEHFNTRNATVVRELKTNLVQNCNVTFGQVQAVDTGTDRHQAMEYIVENLQYQQSTTTSSLPPDAIAGAYNDIPALELSVLATGIQAPLVATRLLDPNLLLPARHPYFTHVAADFDSEMKFVATYLQHIQRTKYVAVIYPSSSGSSSTSSS